MNAFAIVFQSSTFRDLKQKRKAKFYKTNTTMTNTFILLDSEYVKNVTVWMRSENVEWCSFGEAG